MEKITRKDVSAMDEWWQSLALELKVFYVIGITASAILVVQTILMIVGIGGDGLDAADIPNVDVHVDSALEHPGDLHLLSVRTIVAFFMGFGWTGVICMNDGHGIGLSLFLALIVGSLFMSAVFFLMKMLYSLRDSGNIDYKNAIGLIGSVYIPIPPNQSGPGQIEIMIQGRVRFVQAFTKSDRKLTNNCRVKVVEIVDQGTLLVDPLDTSGPTKKEDKS